MTTCKKCNFAFDYCAYSIPNTDRVTYGTARPVCPKCEFGVYSDIAECGCEQLTANMTLHEPECAIVKRAYGRR